MICVSPKQVMRRSFLMETTTISKEREHVHYDHTDDCKFSRWTARESYRFMYYSRPWNSVLGFYANLVANGTSSSSSLASLFGRLYDKDDKDEDLAGEEEEKEDMGGLKNGNGNGKGRWARVTFKLVLAYDGPSFDGWQKQPTLNTVQGLVESSLANFDDKKRDKRVVVVVAGRTDKGVTALRQVCSFFTWRKDIERKDIEEAINSAAPGKLTVKSVSQVSRVFHANFSAKWRRYLYIFPLDHEENGESNASHGSDESREEWEVEEKSRTFRVERVNQLLQRLEGKLLSYKMFARDTKPSRNVGPPTECFMYHARAAEARLPHLEGVEGERVMCVELVANRFLRKMVRVLVATAIREAAAGAEEDVLVKLMDATGRRATAPPAPPDGLCLVDVGYSEFDPQICLISKE